MLSIEGAIGPTVLDQNPKPNHSPVAKCKIQLAKVKRETKKTTNKQCCSIPLKT
tara:strand:+ start:19 stop:180 length:162 start_codon:yes stop_codon:yes gene_type:complete